MKTEKNSMRIRIDKTDAVLKYRMLGGGCMLRIRLACPTGKATLHHQLTNRIVERLGHSAGGRPDASRGYTEIIMIGPTMLELIDALRKWGYHVEEIFPNV